MGGNFKISPWDIVIIRRKFEKKIRSGPVWSRSTCNWKTSERHVLGCWWAVWFATSRLLMFLYTMLLEFGKFQIKRRGISRSLVFWPVCPLETFWDERHRNQQRWMVKFWRSYLIIVILLRDDNNACLISWTDATTLFHEFGHALHGLSSNVTYPTLPVLRCQDYVEFPQILERWLELQKC
jgi:hypothetical protein